MTYWRVEVEDDESVEGLSEKLGEVRSERDGSIAQRTSLFGVKAAMLERHYVPALICEAGADVREDIAEEAEADEQESEVGRLDTRGWRARHST